FVRAGDVITVEIPAEKLADILPQDIPLDVRYEDDYVIIVNKPQGMVVHPAAGNFNGTLVNALMWRYADSLSGINGVIRPGIVHRLDKDTSGLLVIAKNDTAHLALAEQFKARSVLKVYEAIVCGKVKADGVVNAPIGRSASDRKKMCVMSKGNSREAVTHYEVVAQYDKYTHIRVKLVTGRTHQIRVHMASIGHSIAGDTVYGKALSNLSGQCLHAKKLGFIHPQSGERMEIDSELPHYFVDFLSFLESV
ncbi:MAG: RluA family pseudouridine synthase, partial [Oscillospiraceae bacterium]|nr:RluA family pseudouridine synthase [Oscillospiraceae bacterium]